jgi:hypothetical protein
MGQSCVSAKSHGGDDDTVDKEALDADHHARRKLNPLSLTAMETTKVPTKRGQQQQIQNRTERSVGSKKQSEQMFMSSVVPRSSSSTPAASRSPSADHHDCQRQRQQQQQQQQQVLLKGSGGSSSRRIAPSLISPLLLAFPKQTTDDNEDVDDKGELGDTATAPLVPVGASSSLRLEVASVATTLDLDPRTIPLDEEEDSMKQKSPRRPRHQRRGNNSDDVADVEEEEEEASDSSDDPAEVLTMQSRSGMVITSMRSELLWRAAAASGIVASTTGTIPNPLSASSLGSLSVNCGKGKSPLSSTLTSHGGSSRAGWSFSKMHMSGSTGAPPSNRKSMSFSRSGGGSTALDGMTTGTTTSIGMSTAMATPDPSSLKVPEVVTSTTVVRFNDMATVFVGDDVLASSHTSRQLQQQQMHHEPKDDVLASITRCDSESGDDEEERGGGLEEDEWVMIPTSQLLLVIPSTTPTATGGYGPGDDACQPSNASVHAMTGTTCSSSPTTTYATRSTAESPQFAATAGGGIQQRLVVQSSHRAGLAQPTRQCSDFAVWQGSSSNSDVDDDNDDETREQL